MAVIWYGTVRYHRTGTIPYRHTVPHGTVPLVPVTGTVRYGTARNCMVSYGTVRWYATLPYRTVPVRYRKGPQRKENLS